MTVRSLAGPPPATQPDTFMTQPDSPEADDGGAAADADAAGRPAPHAIGSTARGIDSHIAATREYQQLRQQALSQASVSAPLGLDSPRPLRKGKPGKARAG